MPRQANWLAAQLLGQRTCPRGLELAHARRVAVRLVDRGDQQLVSAALLHDQLEEDRHDVRRAARAHRRRSRRACLPRDTRSDRAVRVHLERCASDPRAYALKRADLLDKLVTSDVTVPAYLAAHQARRRLHLLDLLARWKAPW